MDWVWCCLVWYNKVRLGWVKLSEYCLAGLDMERQVRFSYFVLSWAKIGLIKSWFSLLYKRLSNKQSLKFTFITTYSYTVHCTIGTKT